MTNINPDKLIKGEPYLIQINDHLKAGFFVHKYILEENEEGNEYEVLVLIFGEEVIFDEEGNCVIKKHYEHYEPDIGSITHLERKGIIKSA